MAQVKSYLEGKWVFGRGAEVPLVNPATEEVLAVGCTEGLDLGAALTYARDEGGPALRRLTFAQRAELLGATSTLIHDNREELLGLAIRNGGNTRGDAKFDIDGASGTLMYYASLARKALGDTRCLPDGPWDQLGRTPRYFGRHVWTSRQGVALLVNAFNFPAWGFAEKAACAWLAGMPVVVKPAPATALVAVRIVELIVQAGIFPKGALSILSGEPGDVIEHLGPQDVLAFTGSSATGGRLRSAPAVVRSGARVNIEADSLNAAIMGPDIDSDSELFGVFIVDIIRDITQKAGQKCTALRRIFVPTSLVEAVAESVSDALARVVLGNPEVSAVTMGPVTSEVQRAHVREGLARLSSAGARVLAGGGEPVPVGVPAGKGFFVAPHVFLAEGAGADHPVHHCEVFGPVTTILPYSGEPREAAVLTQHGGGGLVAALYSEDRDVLDVLIQELAPHHGRLYLAHGKVASESLGPGSVLPQLLHGGPGRAGAGEELGGVRGVLHYMQRTVVQGYRPLLEKLLPAEPTE